MKQPKKVYNSLAHWVIPFLKKIYNPNYYCLQITSLDAQQQVHVKNLSVG